MTRSERGSDGEEEAAAIRLIEKGSELLGASGGAAIGLLAGPEAAIAGAVGGVLLTDALRRAGSEMYRRVLGPREAARAGATLGVIAERVQERLANGDAPRADFFESRDGRLSDAEELLEGTLLTAARAYEERKVPLLGRMFAALSMESGSGITSGHAHYLLRLAERLTYRQLVMLAVVGAEDRGRLAALDQLAAGRISGPIWGIVQEIDELDSYACLGIEGGAIGVGDLAEMTEHRTFLGVPLSDMALRPTGHLLFDLMELGKVPERERNEVLVEWVPPTGP